MAYFIKIIYDITPKNSLQLSISKMGAEYNHTLAYDIEAVIGEIKIAHEALVNGSKRCRAEHLRVDRSNYREDIRMTLGENFVLMAYKIQKEKGGEGL